jgi:hypothetical protein
MALGLDLASRMLGLDAWWDEPRYKTCNTFHLRGLFIFDKLREHDPSKFQDVLTDLYRDDQPDPEDIGKFEWQTILAYMGAGEDEIADVQRRMGRPRR